MFHCSCLFVIPPTQADGDVYCDTKRCNTCNFISFESKAIPSTHHPSSIGSSSIVKADITVKKPLCHVFPECNGDEHDGYSTHADSETTKCGVASTALLARSTLDELRSQLDSSLNIPLSKLDHHIASSMRELLRSSSRPDDVFGADGAMRTLYPSPIDSSQLASLTRRTLVSAWSMIA